LHGQPFADQGEAVTVKAPDDRRTHLAAWLNLQQASRVIQAALEEQLRASSHLSWPEFELLWRLRAAAAQPMIMSEIATQLLASPSGLTRIADRLERDGLIARGTPPENRRTVHIKLTKRGHVVLAGADRIFRETLEESLSRHLTDAEVASLRRILRKILEGNDAWGDARCDPALGAAESS
jgi:DNA-binding MarR family transcriptional regulator